MATEKKTTAQKAATKKATAKESQLQKRQRRLLVQNISDS